MKVAKCPVCGVLFTGPPYRDLTPEDTCHRCFLDCEYRRGATVVYDVVALTVEQPSVRIRLNTTDNHVEAKRMAEGYTSRVAERCHYQFPVTVEKRDINVAFRI